MTYSIYCNDVRRDEKPLTDGELFTPVLRLKYA